MKSIITKNGFNIMNQNRADGTVQYWIGYYGLAYIPEEDRDLTEDTTELVEGNKGDIIYNLFQGGMTPVGFDTDNGKNSMAARLMNSCMYTGSVINKFRYVLDENDNNHLVVLADYQPESDSLGLREYTQFDGIGVDDKTESELPIPAPLYYIGEPVPYTSAQTTENMPSVSCDTRVYRASKDALTGEVTQELLSRAAIYDWFDSAENVYTQTYSNSETFKNLALYWQYQSVSNFNRFHAQANVSGYAVDYEPSCRNLSKATRLFPISHYDVIDTKDDVTVSQVKYTISIDMDSVFSKITKRTNVYYNDNGEKLESNPFKVGFKFNRIGVYAVPVTLHAYNTGEDSDGNCENHSVQMQISGNEEPQLFAILDLDTPIIMSEGNVTKYDINFQIDFGEKGNIVDSAAIYYNLYEDDAITWYKNQLIANASTAEAVTSLGVQLNYLRKQLNETVTNGQYLCGIGDDGDNYAVSNTGGGLQNLVDGVQPNGSVRGIDTVVEGKPITIYQTGGRLIVYDDDTKKYVFYDNPSEEVPTLFTLSPYNVGEDSLSLGKNSATASPFSLNMSKNGVSDVDCDSILLLGGVDSDQVDFKLAVTRSHNSIFNIGSRAELQSINGSIWMSSDQQVFVETSVENSIGLCGVNVWQENSITSGIEETITSGTMNGTVAGSMINGHNSIYTTVKDSIIVGSRAGRYSAVYDQHIGAYMYMANPVTPYYLSDTTFMIDDINPYYMDNTHYYEYSISTSAGGIISRIMALGESMSVGRDVYNVFAAGNTSRVPDSATNSIIIGNNNNTKRGYIQNPLVFGLDEFNERYGSTSEYPSYDPIWSSTWNEVMVVGTGTLNAMNGDGTTMTHEVNGVTLYISYNTETRTWSKGLTCGPLDGSSDTHNYLGKYPYKYIGLYSTTGHIKNMFMLGDNINAGMGSCNSILMGDYSGSRRIVFKNSFANFLGDTAAYDTSSSDWPNRIFDNVWWIGSGRGTQDSIAGHIIADANHSTYPEATFKDAFVFRGDNDHVYSHAYWYDADWHLMPLGDVKNTLNISMSPYSFYHPINSPMIYTGGIALGGYGVNECNFMLLKIGTSRTGWMDTMVVNKHTPSIVSTENYDDYSAVIRKDTLSGFNSYSESDKSYFIRKYNDDVKLTEASDTITYTLPENTLICRDQDITMCLYDDPTKTLTVTIVSDNVIQGTYSEELPANTKISITYYYTKKKGILLYNLYNEDLKLNHYMIDCPSSGQMLMVQDKQELDGTLHIGLGSPADALYGTKRFISIQTQYIGSSQFTILMNESNTSYTVYAFSTKFSDYGEYDTDYYPDPVTFGLGFKLSAVLNFESTSGGGYNCHIKKMFLEVPLDQRYMVRLAYKNTQTTVIVDNPNDCYIVGVGGYSKLPTYLWIDPSNKFNKLWHPVLWLTNSNSLDSGELYENVNQDDNSHVYKLTPVSWLYGRTDYTTRTFINRDFVTQEIIYTATGPTLSSIFEDVTETEGFTFQSST